VRIQINKILKILAVFFLLVLLIISSDRFSPSLRTGAMELVSPVLDAFNTILSNLGSIMPFASLRDENQMLRDRLSLIARQIEEMKVIYDENRRLKELLGFRKNLPYATVPAEVIGRDPSNWSNSLVINKGSSSGIKPGKAVISARGLVGRIVETGRASSKVLLITDPSSRVGVLIQRNRQGGILLGRPDGMCKIVYISLDSDVSPGDKVITAGFGGAFPKNMLVGLVVEVGKEPGRLYKYAIVDPAQDLSKLEEVLCVR
jgi:rod shape-determining protein MreC